MPCVWFAFLSGASGITLYDAWAMLLYNTVYTALPSISVGLFEKDLHEEIVLKYPRVYGAQDKLQSRGLFHWVSNGVFHSLIIFFGCCAIHKDIALFTNGQMTDLQTFGAFVLFISFHIVLLKMLLETGHWVIWTWVSFALSIVSYYVAEIILGVFLSRQILELSFVFPMMVCLSSLWCGLLLAIPACLIADVSFKYYNRQTWPKARHILQEYYFYKETLSKKSFDPKTAPLLLTDEFEMQ